MFPSPSGKAAIEIWQTRFDNFWKAQVELVTDHRRTVLYRQPRDAGIYFVHVYWTSDETEVGVVATGAAVFSVAADVRTGAARPFGEIRTAVAQSIRDTYRVPPDEKDPIAWAGLADAQAQFFMRHPEVRLTYHQR